MATGNLLLKKNDLLSGLLSLPLSLQLEAGLCTQACLSWLPAETPTVTIDAGDILGRDTDARCPHSLNIFSSYSHNLCLIGINPFSGWL